MYCRKSYIAVRSGLVISLKFLHNHFNKISDFIIDLKLFNSFSFIYNIKVILFKVFILSDSEDVPIYLISFYFICRTSAFDWKVLELPWKPAKIDLNLGPMCLLHSNSLLMEFSDGIMAATSGKPQIIWQ